MVGAWRRDFSLHMKFLEAATSMTKPKDHWLNQRQMAASLGITVGSFAAWQVEPVARIGKQAFYDMRSVLDNRLNHAEQGPSSGDMEAERLRLTKAQAEGQEIKNELAKGRTVPIELITLTLSTVAGAASGILDSLPLTIKRKYPELDNALIESIKRQCVKAQNEIARTDEIVYDRLQEFIGDQL
ncbi:terminase small subunit [Marinobacter sp. SS5-14b]|uniref:terminase small subunit n=1 Tax=Marinobacter sp. SS5-14b TaxID=3050456 RepID=UPI0026E0F3EC|nr:terminase small subunit [Marinobacter sp. SS5-14b]